MVSTKVGDRLGSLRDDNLFNILFFDKQSFDPSDGFIRDSIGWTFILLIDQLILKFSETFSEFMQKELNTQMLI